MESEEERLRAERLETYEQQREQDRIAREERLLIRRRLQMDPASQIQTLVLSS